MTTSEARRKAQKLLLEAGIATPPVNVFDIAEHLKIRCRAAELGDEVSGLLMVKDDEAVIGYNKRHSKSRQRFTVAHELAHFILHSKQEEIFIDKGAFIMYRDENSTKGDDPHEKEANAFAAELLMPQAFIQSEIAQRGLMFSDEKDIEILAHRFEVSIQAMTFRLLNLRLIRSAYYDSE